MQNAGLDELGLNWRYLAFDVLPEHLVPALEGTRSMRYVGLNLTVPHKLLALEWVELLDESARKWGAVNTVRFEGKDPDDKWVPLGQAEDPNSFHTIRSVGFNTDADAIATSITQDLGLSLNGSHCVLLGAGGAGRVAALKLAESGVESLYLINRTASKAMAIAEELRGAFPELRVATDYPNAGEKIDLVLNATSLGLKASDAVPFDPEALNLEQASHAYDMIYQPTQTPFLKKAHEAGCRTSNGLGMLLYQGAAALEIWTGQAPPVDTMRKALCRHLDIQS